MTTKSEYLQNVPSSAHTQSYYLFIYVRSREECHLLHGFLFAQNKEIVFHSEMFELKLE